MGRITQKTQLISKMNFQSIVLLAIIPSSFGVGEKRCTVGDATQCADNTQSACHFKFVGKTKDTAEIQTICEVFGNKPKKCASATVSNNVDDTECCMAPVDAAADSTAPLLAKKEFRDDVTGACLKVKKAYDKVKYPLLKCSPDDSCTTAEMDACFYKISEEGKDVKISVECEKVGTKCASTTVATIVDNTQCCAPADAAGTNMESNKKEFKDGINQACKDMEAKYKLQTTNSSGNKTNDPNPSNPKATTRPNTNTNGSNINNWSLWVLLTIYINLNF